MKKLLLLSNGRVAGQSYLEYALPWIAEHLKAAPTTPKTILFVPYALKNHEAYAEIAATALAPLGIRVVSAHSVKNPCDLLDKVDGVFVGGGNTFRLLKGLQENGLLVAIRKKAESGMPYMGASAGINIVSPTIKTTNDMPIVMPISFDALNLVPFQINPHYVDGKFYYEENGEKVPYNGETRAQRIAEFHEENNTTVIGIKEGSAVKIVGNHAELLGGKTAVVFQQGKAPLEITNGEPISSMLAKAKIPTLASGQKKRL